MAFVEKHDSGGRDGGGNFRHTKAQVEIVSLVYFLLFVFSFLFKYIGICRSCFIKFVWFVFAACTFEKLCI